jgi:hypothetical protein
MGGDMAWENPEFDVELRNELVPQIAAALREAVPGATHAHIHVNDTETEAPYLYAGVILDAEGKRIEMGDPAALENQVINALVDMKTKYSWDGYPLVLDLVRAVEMDDDMDLYDLITD